MNRQTSIACYHQIKREGLLSKRRIQVLEAMITKAPCTAGELEKHMNSVFNITGGWKQLSVLRDQGVLYEKGTRECKITGRKVIEWDITGNLPVIPKKSSKPKNINKVIDYLIEGMDLRNWDVISKSMLIKLKISEDGITKKKKV